MCGIAGIAGVARDCRVEAAEVRRMCDAIVHRGPDDEGVMVQGHVGLGMRRLSIIDLASGHQPIHNEDRNIWIVFNGEIYKFGTKDVSVCFSPETGSVRNPFTTRSPKGVSYSDPRSKHCLR